VYYELMRFLLWSCYRSVLAIAASDRSTMSAGDFLTVELPRLAARRDEYLEEPNADFSGRTPRAIMEHERLRLPEGMSGRDAMVDGDCPLCQMQAEMPGPVFWHLDGCNMDEEFAFSFHRTQEEWYEEQREQEEWNRRWKEEEAERKRLGVSYPGGGYSDPGYVWQRSFVARDSEEGPLLIRLFSIGSMLCELTVDLKEPSENRALIERLTRDWGNLREVVGATEASVQPELVEAVLDRFCQTLAEVAAERSDLQRKCNDLADRLRRFMEPPSVTEEDFDSPEDEYLPF
jgi:hypothetical protein